MQQFFLLELYLRNLLWTLYEIWAVWPLYEKCTVGVKKKQISISKSKFDKQKTWSSLYLKYKGLHVFIFWELLLKMEICFFLTPPSFVHGLIFWRILDFETFILQEFSKYHVKFLHFQKPDGVACLKNVFTS